MTAMDATLTPADRTVPLAQTPALAVGTALAQVSALVVELDPGDGAWRHAGPHVTAVVTAVRHALDGSCSPIAADDDVSPMLRLRDLACTAQRAAGSPDVSLPSVEIVEHLAALAAVVDR